jgi:hypothetical protein
MRKTGFAIALAAMLVVPSAAMAAPTKADTKAASALCHKLRAEAPSKAEFLAMGDPDFKTFGDCVSRTAKLKAAARRAAAREVQKDCKEQGLTGKAYGQCVKAGKAEAKEEAAAEDKQKVNAAKTCRDEKTNAPDDYAEHGTGKNAFGKCVSAHAKAKRTGADPHPDAV